MKKIVFLSSVAGASIILSFFSLFSKGIGFLREIIYANNFGLSSDYDLFLSSTALIIIIQTVFIYFAQHYFIPIYNKVKLEGEHKGEEFFNYAFWWSLIAGIILSLILFLLSKPFLSLYLSGLDKSRLDNALMFFWILILSIPFNNGISVISAYLQAKFLFIYPAVCQIIINIVIIFIVFFLSGNIRIIILPISITFAYVIAFAFLFWVVRNIKYNWKVIFRYEAAFIKKGNLFNLLIIEFVSLSYILVDRYFIDKIPTGSISAMSYAIVLFSLPISVFSIPLVTALFSKFSRDHVKNSAKLESDFFISLKVNHFVIILLAAIMYLWGDVFLRLFYERGAFNSESTIITHEILKCYLVGMIFLAGYYIQVKLFYSLDGYKVVMWLSIIAIIIKVVFNFLLVGTFKQNGLAFSTSIVYIFLFLGANYIIERNYFKKSISSVFQITFYYLFNVIFSFLFSSVLTDIFFKYSSPYKTVLVLTIFVLTYIFNIYLMKGEEIKTIVTPISNFLKLRTSN